MGKRSEKRTFFEIKLYSPPNVSYIKNVAETNQPKKEIKMDIKNVESAKVIIIDFLTACGTQPMEEFYEEGFEHNLDIMQEVGYDFGDATPTEIRQAWEEIA